MFLFRSIMESNTNQSQAENFPLKTAFLTILLFMQTLHSNAKLVKSHSLPTFCFNEHVCLKDIFRIEV